MPSCPFGTIGPVSMCMGKPDPIIPNHKRIDECAKESQILLWTWKILDEVPCYYYDHYLWDGSVLCRFMNVIKPGSVKQVILPADNIREKKQNIENFLQAAASYGIEKESLFQVDDLLLLQNLPRVTACIFALGKQVKQDPSFKGRYFLGEIPYEPLDPRTRRRAGMPHGEDLHVAHVDISMLKKMMLLEQDVQPQ